MTCAVYWNIYWKGNRYIKYYFYLHACAGMVFIIMSHLHYTLDVVIAMFLTWSTHSLSLPFSVSAGSSHRADLSIR